MLLTNLSTILKEEKRGSKILRRKRGWEERNKHPCEICKVLLFLRGKVRCQWHTFRPHSLMDKIQDSGSCDLGSIPGEVTLL